jgi:hypothetical protein
MRPVNETRMAARWKLGRALAKVERATAPGKGKMALTSLTSLLQKLSLTKPIALEAQRIGCMPDEEMARLFEEARKTLYEKLHPETKHGGAPPKKGKGGGAGKQRSQNEIFVFEPADAFIDDTAKKTRKGRSTIARAATRGKNVKVLPDIVGTSLDQRASQESARGHLARVEHRAQEAQRIGTMRLFYFENCAWDVAPDEKPFSQKAVSFRARRWDPIQTGAPERVSF